MELLGPRLKAIRMASGKTQEQAAEGTGMSQGMISAFENGKGDPSLSTVRRLAAFYGRKMVDLFADEMPPPPPRSKPTPLEIAEFLFDHGTPDLERAKKDIIKRVITAQDDAQIAVLSRVVDDMFSSAINKAKRSL
jgi:transcriptional regulator with XRE-family HTH domain